MAKAPPTDEQAKAALDKHLKAVNKITDAEKKHLKTMTSLAKAMGETVEDVEALLSIRAKTRDLDKELLDLNKSIRLSQDVTVKASQKALDLKQKELENQAKINAKFAKMKEHWDGFFAIATDPKIVQGLAFVASADKAKELGESLLDARASMGITYTQTLQLGGALASAAGSGLLLGFSFAETLEAAAALNDVMGDITETTSTAIKTVAHLSKKYSIATSDAAGLYKQIKLMSGGTDAMVEAQLKHVEHLARANNVAPKAALESMAKSSEFMAKYMGENSKSMAETAVQAALLGTDLTAIDSMMTSILDIESSIEKEMQVSVLLGRQISFDKARQLAMAGKTLEATKAIVQQVGGIAEFEKMSVIQRKALADAAGIDLTTMQSILGNREKQIELGLVEQSTAERAAELAVGAGTTIMNNLTLAMTLSQLAVNWNLLKMTGHVKEKAQMLWRWMFSKKSHMDRMRQLVKERAAKRAAAAADAATAGTSSLGGSKQNPIKSAGKMGSGATKLLKGAAAMLIMAAAVLVFAVAMQQLAKVDWDAIWPGAVIALIALAGAMALFGQGPVAVIMMAGAYVFAAMSVSLLLFGVALNVVAMALPVMVTSLTQLAAIGGSALMSIGLGFGVMGVGLASMAAGLLLITPMLPTLLVLGGLAKLGGMNLMGGGDSGKDDSSNVVAEKLDVLIDLMKKGGIVKMDGKEVGEVIALALGVQGT
jgi:hypothetical protein